MADGKQVLYFRVSTQKQGRSGLGLSAQRESVHQFLNGGKWETIGEFVEVESGKRSDRPQLEKALKLARVHNATLVVAKIDRLSRSVAFISKLMESGGLKSNGTKSCYKKYVVKNSSPTRCSCLVSLMGFLAENINVFHHFKTAR